MVKDQYTVISDDLRPSFRSMTSVTLNGSQKPSNNNHSLGVFAKINCYYLFGNTTTWYCAIRLIHPQSKVPTLHICIIVVVSTCSSSVDWWWRWFASLARSHLHPLIRLFLFLLTCKERKYNFCELRYYLIS